MKGNIVVITGRPGIGKSTVLRKVIEKLRSRGYKVGGMICPEVRGFNGRRVGFKIEGWLARANEPGTPRVGKYHVRVDEASRVGVQALERALKECDIIAIDEIGPMELLVNELKQEFIKVLSSGKPVIAVVHYKLRDQEILRLLRGGKWYTVSVENRDKLPDLIFEDVVSYVRS